MLVVGSRQQIKPVVEPTEKDPAISVLFAREGARVAVAEANEKAAEETVDRIRSDGGNAYAIRANLAFEADVGWMMREACEALGGSLDGLVLNVASEGDVEHNLFDAREWTRIHDLSVRGPMLCCREALPNLRDGGSVVFITSFNGPGTGWKKKAYDSAGTAIFGLMHNVAEEIASRNIRANLIYSVQSCAPLAFRAHAFGENHVSPVGQSAAAAIANAALFFLSDESAHLTAQTLAVMQGHDGQRFEGRKADIGI